MLVDLLLVIFAIVLSIIGAMVASSMQQKGWTEQYRRSIEDAQLQRAQALCDKFVELSDRRIYRLRRLLWAVAGQGRIDRDKAREDYLESVFAWNDSFGYFRANLLSFYSFSEVVEFESEIHNRFQKLGARVENVLHNESVSLGTGINREIDLLAKDCYAFCARLQQHIRDRTLPHFADAEEISFENVGRLSSMHLIRRLYGISSKVRGV
jgi:hypothetical protein